MEKSSTCRLLVGVSLGSSSRRRGNERRRAVTFLVPCSGMLKFRQWRPRCAEEDSIEEEDLE